MEGVLREMDVMNESLDPLISDFLAKVEEAVSLLEQAFGERCILGLWRGGAIERCGTVVGDITYELHGVGCAVYLPDVCIDFDYGPDGRTDGFDAWRLYLYACERPLDYPQYVDQNVLDVELAQYLASGKVERLSDPYCSLYFLKAR